MSSAGEPDRRGVAEVVRSVNDLLGLASVLRERIQDADARLERVPKALLAEAVRGES